MFRRVWWKGVRSARSSEGYSVNLRGPKYGLEYREGDRVLRICVETAAVEVDWIMYPSSIESWLPPYQSEHLDEARRQQIRKRVVGALDFLGVKYRIAE